MTFELVLKTFLLIILSGVMQEPGRGLSVETHLATRNKVSSMERRGDYSYKEQHCSGDSEMSCNQVLRQLSAAGSSVLCSSQRVFCFCLPAHSCLSFVPSSFSSFLFFPENHNGIRGKGGKAIEKHSLRLSMASEGSNMYSSSVQERFQTETGLFYPAPPRVKKL